MQTRSVVVCWLIVVCVKLWAARSSDNTLSTLQTLRDDSQHIFTLLVVVLTTPPNLERRTIIREGWHSRRSAFLKRTSHIKFVVSKQDKAYNSSAFQAEAEKMGDFLVCDTPTGFQNIIHKVSCAIKYATMKNLKFEYFFKTDDDSTICLGDLMRELKSKVEKLGNREDFIYFGRVLKTRRRVMNIKPLYQNLGMVQDPPHFGGHGYGVSLSLHRYLSWMLTNYRMHHHLHEDTNFALWLVPLDIHKFNSDSLQQFIRSNSQIFSKDPLCAELLKKRNFAFDSGGKGEKNNVGVQGEKEYPRSARCYDAKRPLVSLPDRCFKCESCESKRTLPVAVTKNIPEFILPTSTMQSVNDSRELVVMISSACEDQSRRELWRQKYKTKKNQENGVHWHLQLRFIVPGSNICRETLAEKEERRDDVLFFDRKLGTKSALDNFLMALKYAVQQTSFNYLVVLLGETVEVPLPAALVQAITSASKSHDDGKPPQLYGGGRFVQGQILPREIDNAIKIKTAVNYFSDGIFLSRSLAEYLSYALSRVLGVKLHLSDAPQTIEHLEMLVGIWLAPFKVDYLKEWLR